ncbi:MAG: GAF domain-containing protein [Bacteroidales bacterium]|nr:GAF domain-containing protein [Bacteroidales bacterium]
MNNRISQPSSLFSNGVLDYKSAGDKAAMENIIHEELAECLIIGIHKRIYYSINPDHIDKLFTNIPGIKKYNEIIQELVAPYNEKIKENGEKYLVSISPIYNNNSKLIGYLFIKTNLNHFYKQKQNVLIAIILIAILGLSFSAFLIFTIINKNITKRIYKLLNITEKLKEGDLNIDQAIIEAEDEIGSLVGDMNTLVEQLRYKVKFANEIEKGNFKFEYELKNNKDQLGKALIDMRDSLHKAADDEKKRRLEDEKRNWSTQGLAKFADILRQHSDNINELAYSIISNLVKYLNANQSSLFLLEKENSYLDQIACYAYEKRKYQKKQIDMNEGLIGAVARERKTMYLTEIPDSYIEITSGLGKANPEALLIIPLLREEELLGIMEIASFNEFEEHQIEFVEKLGESIASTIYNAKINTTTSELLKKSQEQAEQMRTQEEEMRQNMEELSATQEEMARKHTELNNRIKELEDELEAKQKELKKYKLND